MTGAEWFEDRPGGLNRYFQSLYGSLAKLDTMDVSAAAFGAAPPGATSWGPSGLGLAQRVLRSQWSPRAARGAILDRHFALYGPPARPGVSLVIHFQGPWALESEMAGANKRRATMKRQIERARYRHADLAIVLSRAFAETLVDDYEFPQDRVRILPPGVDLDRFGLLPVGDQANPTVVCVRRLERRMGIDVLLNSWRSVLDVHPSASLLVIGSGSENASLRAQARRLDLGRAVKFLGRISDDEMSAAYASARCTVVPTRGLEGFGLVALESLAMGRAPVVTRCGGLPDAVEGLDPTLVVEPEDAEALAERLILALDGVVPDAKSCRMHAETFSWSRVAEQHARLYAELG